MTATVALSAEAIDATAIDSAYSSLPPHESSALFRLYEAGEVTERSPSEADAHLFRLLALAGIRDPEQLERIGRSAAIATTVELYHNGVVGSKDSSRARKWARHDYISRTIRNALLATEQEHRKRQARQRLATESPTADGPTQARTLREVWADPHAQKPPEPVLPRIAWKGRLTVYTALDKAGKSTLVAAAVGAMTRGENFLGEPTVKGSCLWAMHEEHVNDWAIRAKRFATDEDTVSVLEHPADPMSAIRTEAERLRPTVLVVDVLTRYAGERVTESGSAAQWTAVMAALQDIARQLDVAVVVLHHARKSDGGARDSTEITARADVVLEQKTLPEDGVQRFTVRGRWTLADFAVKLVGDRHELAAGGAGEKLSPQRRKVLDALKDGMSFTEWQKASDVPKRTFADSVRWLLEQVQVEHGQDGMYNRPRF